MCEFWIQSGPTYPLSTFDPESLHIWLSESTEHSTFPWAFHGEQHKEIASNEVSIFKKQKVITVITSGVKKRISHVLSFMPYQTSEVAGWWVLPQASTTVYLMFYMLKNKSKIIKEFKMNTRKSIVDSLVGFYWNHGKSWNITLPHTRGADMEALHALGSRFPVLPPDTDPWRMMTNGWVVFFNLEASAHTWKPCLGKSWFTP